ncbi:MAG: response regulator, partial [Rhodoferax sp.]
VPVELQGRDDESAAGSNPVPLAALRPLAGMRILVVEDNLLNQLIAEQLLSAEGALVALAANGELGVAAVAAAQPQFDVVLMDIQMPVLDGFAATRRIREQLGLTRLPIVAMTANAMASDRQQCLNAGMTEHVGKPFQLSKLRNLLLRLTGREPVAAVADGSGSLSAVAVVDHIAALDRMGGAGSVYLMAVAQISRDLVHLAPGYRAALEQGQEQAARHLHSAKGASSMVGANQLAQFCSALEMRCKAAEPVDALRAEADALEALAQTTLEALRAVALQVQGDSAL